MGWGSCEPNFFAEVVFSSFAEGAETAGNTGLEDDTIPRHQVVAFRANSHNSTGRPVAEDHGGYEDTVSNVTMFPVVHLFLACVSNVEGKPKEVSNPGENLHQNY